MSSTAPHPRAPGLSPWPRLLRAAAGLALLAAAASLALAAVVAEEASAGSADAPARAQATQACLALFADAYRLIGPAAYGLLARCDPPAQGCLRDVQASTGKPR